MNYEKDTIFRTRIFSNGILWKCSTSQITHSTKECASCHFGYQPALLNKASWEKVMGNLSDHFGTDASLGKAETQEL